MIEELSPESPHYQRVINLGNANSATLGFLPFEAINQAASEGRVLAFVDGDGVKGYALYGKRARTGDISLTHLCVERGQRGQGNRTRSGRGHRPTQLAPSRDPSVVPQGLRREQDVAPSGVSTLGREAGPRQGWVASRDVVAADCCSNPL